MQWLFNIGAVLIIASLAAIGGMFFAIGLIVWVALLIGTFVFTSLRPKRKDIPPTRNYPAVYEPVERRPRFIPRVVDHRFVPAAADKRELVPASFAYPVLPAGHAAIAREYLTAGVAVGLTLMHRGKTNVLIHPAVINRFADAEFAYSALGYRTLPVESFVAFASDASQADGIKLGVLRPGDEPLVHFAGGIRRSLRNRTPARPLA